MSIQTFNSDDWEVRLKSSLAYIDKQTILKLIKQSKLATLLAEIFFCLLHFGVLEKEPFLLLAQEKDNKKSFGSVGYKSARY